MSTADKSTARPHVSTTHDPMGGGKPRLIFASGGRELPADDGGASGRPADFELLPGLTTIGSGSTCDLVLAGLADRHAEIRRDAADEYIFVAKDAAGRATVNGTQFGMRPLHTGDRIELGDWVMSFYREEFADHGRPYGGRQGSDRFHQQPERGPRDRGTSVEGGSQPADGDPGEYA